MRRPFLLATAIAVGLTSSAVTQSTGAPPAVLDRYQLSEGSIQTLTVPQTLNQRFEVVVSIDGTDRRLKVNRHSMFGPRFELLVDDGQQIRRAPTPAIVTYRGHAEGLPGSQVAAGLIDGQLWAQIHFDERLITVQPLSEQFADADRRSHIVYDSRHLLATDVSCGQHGDGALPIDGLEAGTALQTYDLALDLNNFYYNNNGGTVAGATAAATTLINAVDLIYVRDVSVCARLSSIIVRTSQVYQDGPQVGCVQGPDLLDEMIARWRANHVGVRRDTAHMLSGWGAWSGIIGCAYLRAICASPTTGVGYGVSRTVNPSLARNVGLVAHELGHNWGSNHCNSNRPCYIMCSGLGGCDRDLTRFGTFAINSILAHKATRTCLDTCCSAPASYTLAESACGRTPPVMTNRGLPQVGGTYDVLLSSAPAGAAAVRMTGLRPARIDLGPLGAPRCFLWLDPSLVLAFDPMITDRSGNARVSRTVPNQANLCGRIVYEQIAVLSSENQLGAITTQRADVRIGR